MRLKSTHKPLGIHAVMGEIIITALPFWAPFVTALGWLYSALAFFWPWLFHRDVIAHAVRDELGYHIGRAIYWQLPRRPALFLAAASVIPLLALVLLPQGPAVIVSALAAAAILALWLTNPPGQRMGLMERGLPGQDLAFEPRASGDIFRAILVFTLFGVMPAAVIGAGLNFLLRLWLR